MIVEPDSISESNDYACKTKSMTPITTPYIDWEDTTKILINNYGMVTLPWYNGAQGSMPESIINDYKKSDGWELLYNFCSDKNENTLGNKNYLIFYNKISGKLRIFYYSPDIITNGTTTIAQLRTENPTWMFAFNNAYASQYMEFMTGNKEACSSLVTTSDNRSTSLGWNCFDIELAYDPSIGDNNHFGISFYDQNISSLTLKGFLNSKAKGSISTTNVTNSMNPIINLIGDNASEAIEEAYENGVKNKKAENNKSVIGGLLGSLGSKIITTGINHLFSSFIARFDKENEEESLIEIHSEGTADFSGNIMSSIPSAIPPIQNLRLPGTEPNSTDYISPLYDKVLGAWSIREIPQIAVDDVLTPTVYPAQSKHPDYKYFCVDYNRYVHFPAFTKTEILVNPETLACISDYDVSIEYFILAKQDGIDYTLKNHNQYLKDCVYERQRDSGSDSFSSAETLIYKLGNVIEFENSDINNPLYSYRKSLGDDIILKQLQTEVTYKVPATQNFDNLIAKITVTFYPKAPYNDKPVVSTKTVKLPPAIRVVEQTPVYIYNPYVKPEYIDDEELWNRRWDWTK